MEQDKYFRISSKQKSDGYVEAILAIAIQERDDLIAEEPALKKIQKKIDKSMENIEEFQDRLLILAAATRFMTNKL